jgi:hypothetical protein
MTAYRDRGALVEASQGGEVVEFRPERHQLTVAALDFGIKQATRIRDWPALEEAVDLKIEEQRKFYAWWQNTIRSQGEARKKENRGPGFLSVADAEGLTGMKQQRVSDLGKWLNRPDDTYRRHLLGAAYRAAMLDDEHDHRIQGSDEWFTPAPIIECVRAFYGGQIDCDPASNARAQETIRATTFFTAADDGLSQDWFGRTWLNAPFSMLTLFIEKLIHEFTVGHVSEAVVLTNGATDPEWFHSLLATATAVCFLRGRLRFLTASGEVAPNGPTMGQALFYLGPRPSEFARAFGGSVGSVLDPMRYRSAARMAA